VIVLKFSGMFDEYLSEQPELGSDMISNAQLQYQAVMGVHAKRQVISTCLTCDIQVLEVFQTGMVAHWLARMLVAS
jgi:hypothetical protein